MVIGDMQQIITKMNALRVHGVRFSLDDFGSGYSSLSYLTALPLYQLKIDQSFVRRLPANSGDAVVAGAIVSLGHSLGLSVIAEGVETQEQHDFLAKLGCDAFQGYHFGRPVPAGQLTVAAQER
jgi:EAL domain-containing protein (putative c-di-GMP-specific phosphodiesterase class I)